MPEKSRASMTEGEEVKMADKSINPVEQIREFLANLPQEPQRGLLSPEPTKEEIAARNRSERLRTLLQMVQLRLSTMSYLGSANEYLATIAEADETISRAFKVSIAALAINDVLGVHQDLELGRQEARKAYKEAGIEFPVDMLTATLDGLMKLIQAGITKSTLAKPE